MKGIPAKYKKACANLLLAAVIVIICIYVVPGILLLFMPFILGWFLACLVNPLVHFLEEKIKLKRQAGTILVMITVILMFGLLVIGLGNRLIYEFLGFLRIMPEMWQDMKLEFVSVTERWSGFMDNLPVEVVEKAGELGEKIGHEFGVMVGQLSMPTAQSIGDFTGNLPSIFMAVLMCVLSAYFFVAEKGNGISRTLERIPASWREKCLLLKKTTIDVMAAYLKAQLKIEIWIYLLIVAGFFLLKVRYGYLVALPIALLDLLPVLGTGVILIPWSLFKILTGEYLYALGLFLIWGISQLARQIIQPKVIGDSMGLASVPTLVLIYVGYKLAGVAGMIVAVPFGILFLAMNEAGFFDNTKDSIRILWEGFREFRVFEEDDRNETKL